MSGPPVIVRVMRRGDLGPWPGAWRHFTREPGWPDTRVPVGDPYCHVHAGLALSVAEVRALAVARGPMVALDAWQDGSCALCGGEVPLRWMIADHCHTTGWVRGLLCMSCNAQVSHGPRRARDRDRGLAVARYLEHPPAALLGLRVRYHDVRGWKAACAARRHDEAAAVRAALAAQEERLAARRG
jgi:hypothetical protein